MDQAAREAAKAAFIIPGSGVEPSACSMSMYLDLTLRHGSHERHAPAKYDFRYMHFAHGRDTLSVNDDNAPFAWRHEGSTHTHICGRPGCCEASSRRLSLLFQPMGGATVVLFLQITFVFMGLLSCCGLVYGVHRLRSCDAHLYWADLILASLAVLLVTMLFLLINMVGAAAFWRIGVGSLGLVVIGYRLCHLHPHLWREYKSWYRYALTDTSLAGRLHHLAALVHWHT